VGKQCVVLFSNITTRSHCAVEELCKQVFTSETIYTLLDYQNGEVTIGALKFFFEQASGDDVDGEFV
jgi:hypothetical protein